MMLVAVEHRRPQSSKSRAIGHQKWALPRSWPWLLPAAFLECTRRRRPPLARTLMHTVVSNILARHKNVASARWGGRVATSLTSGVTTAMAAAL